MGLVKSVMIQPTQAGFGHPDMTRKYLNPSLFDVFCFSIDVGGISKVDLCQMSTSFIDHYTTDGVLSFGFFAHDYRSPQLNGDPRTTWHH